MNLRHNLFSYATSELSQDAFICWLMSFAMNDDNPDIALQKCAQDLIRQFLSVSSDTPIIVNDIERQIDHIDILLTVNNTYKVIIEDKTYTQEHDDQLNVYKKLISEKYPEFIVVGVYFKIGFQSNYEIVDNSGYMRFCLDDILRTISKYQDKTSNRIFLDYYEYLINIKQEINKFKVLPIAEWNWLQINGFYEFAKNNKKNYMYYDFGYVHNPNGGFYGMWLYNNHYITLEGLKFELYLQCEYVEQKMQICYKASAQDEDVKIKGTLRDKMIWKQQDNSKWRNLAKENNFIKPSRFGSGKTVTLGIFNAAPTDYEQLMKAIEDAVISFNNLTEDLLQE